MDRNLDDLTFSVRADTTQATRALEDLSRQGQTFAKTLTSAFVDIAIKGQSLDDRLRKLALSLSNLVLNAALKPVEQALGQVFQSALSGGIPFAKGGVPGRAVPTLFASGGVVAAPVAFGFGNGQLGIAGEAGAEAILPLARGSDGRLGVRAEGGGRSSGAVVVNIATPDIASFHRSETQVAATISRMLARGKRNL